MDKLKLLKPLEKICLGASSGITKTNYSKMWMREGVTVFLYEDDMINYYDIIKEIYTDPLIQQNFSIKEIEEHIQKIISKILKFDSKSRSNKIEKEVDNFLLDLSKDIHIWTFLIPIENLSLEKRSFSIGKVKIFKFTNNQLNKYVKKHNNIMNRNSHYRDKKTLREDIKKNYATYFLKPLLNSYCAEIEVKGKLEGAKILALREIKIVAGIIKLFSYSSDLSREAYFGIKGEVIPPTSRVIIATNKDGDSIHPSFERMGYLFNFEIGKNRLKFMKENGLKKVINIYTKPEKSDLDKKIMNSIYWYARSFDIPEIIETELISKKYIPLKSNGNEVEFMNLAEILLILVIFFESLLIFGHESKSENLSTRSSFLLNKDKNIRKKIKKYVKKVYDIRSDIVHEGIFVVSKTDTNFLMSFVQQVIFSLLKIKDLYKLKNNENLYQWFEKNRLKDRAS